MSKPTTDEHNPLVSVQEFPNDKQLQVINSYGDGGFRIAKQIVSGSQFVLPRKTADWGPQTDADIDVQEILFRLSGTGTVCWFWDWVNGRRAICPSWPLPCGKRVSSWR